MLAAHKLLIVSLLVSGTAIYSAIQASAAKVSVTHPGLAVSSAEQCSKAWLAAVDRGDYAESWKRASPNFQAAVTQSEWVQDLIQVRKPLGKELHRVLVGAEYTIALPGVPSGQYVVIQYHTAFSKAAMATETATPMLDKDGKWRVSGYYIKR